MSKRPENIGIKGLEIYIPSRIVNQAELEKHNDIPAGKYTIGLGQTNMSFVDDREDVYSMALTVVSRLLKKYNVDPASVGRLEVGTETLLDKSKSVKTVLMQLFGDNNDIEGIDSVNACYSGTNALFNSVAWVESSAWDGRYAIAVAADIAIYAKGNARPTGGVGAVAMLIGPDAPLVLDPFRGTYMQHAYDFYKPDFTSEYPVVDGQFSLTCYTRAFDRSYQSYNAKAAKRGLEGAGDKKGAERFDYSVYHVPTCKQASKTFARMYYNDFLDGVTSYTEEEVPKEVRDVSYEDSLTNKAVEKTFMTLAKKNAATRAAPGLIVPTNTGNMYTASLYGSLASLLGHVPQEDLAGKRISLFSYGSGLASSMFSLVVKGDISTIVKNLDIKNQLADRTTVTPQQYEEALKLREKAHLAKNYKPTGDVDSIKDGVYYLTEIDERFQRKYTIKGTEQTA